MKHMHKRLDFSKIPAVGAITLFILFYCLDYYFRISPSLVFHQLQQQYHTDALGMGALASAFYLGYLVMQIPSGIILDRLPIYRVVIPAIFMCTFAFIGFILNHHYWIGYLLRWVIGGTSAFSFIAVIYIARQYLDIKWFGVVSGITIAAGTVSASIAQLASAVLIQYFHWHTIFISLALWGFVVSILLLLPGLKLPPRQGKLISQTSWWHQIKQFSRHPLLILNGLVGGLFYLPTALFATMWGIPFLQGEYHFSATAASFGVTVLFMGWALGAPLIGGLADRTKHYMCLVSVGALFGTMVSVTLIYLTPDSSWIVWALLFLFGLFSSAQVVVWKCFRDHCPRAIVGYGVAFTNMLIMVFGAIFHLAVGWLMAHVVPMLVPNLDYKLGLSIIPIAFMLVLILSFIMPVFKMKPLVGGGCTVTPHRNPKH